MEHVTIVVKGFANRSNVLNRLLPRVRQVQGTRVVRVVRRYEETPLSHPDIYICVYYSFGLVTILYTSSS